MKSEDKLVLLFLFVSLFIVGFAARSEYKATKERLAKEEKVYNTCEEQFYKNNPDRDVNYRNKAMAELNRCVNLGDINECIDKWGETVNRERKFQEQWCKDNVTDFKDIFQGR